MNIFNLLPRLLLTVVLVVFALTGKSQSFFEPSDTLNKKRFTKALVFTGTTYTAFSVGLYNIWYRQYEQESFHLFNDWGEWRHMDKIGHVHTAYLQGVLCYKGARWTGLGKKPAIITGTICGMLFQSTIEVMDGFSSKWGFSIPDMAANVSGVGIFALQQSLWDEQRIGIKVSSVPISYSTEPIISRDGLGTTSLKTRTGSLFGHNYFERYLKDYNAQVYWLSFNVHSFLPENNRWPQWLNLAVGYGAQNMFGGYANNWTSDGHEYTADPAKYPRYSQLFVGPDIDLTRIRTRSPFLRSVLSVLNVFKVPGPAVEFNTRGQVVFHILR